MYVHFMVQGRKCKTGNAEHVAMHAKYSEHPCLLNATVLQTHTHTYPNHELRREQVQEVGHRHHRVSAAHVHFPVVVQAKPPAVGVLM